MADDHYTKDLAASLRKALRTVGESSGQELAPPEEPQDGRNVGPTDFVATFRALTMQDPTYPQQTLDRLAPVALTLPDGTRLRSQIGLKNYHDLMKAAFPHVWLAAVSDPGGD